MSELKILLDMGFSKERAEYALKVTNYNGVEPAMEWLLAHASDDIPQADLSLREKPNENNAVSTDPNDKADAKAKPKSLKCDECGKVFIDQGEIEFHAAKTGHTGFSESTDDRKPLTEEERKVQLALIEEKLKIKRIEREEREKTDALERERNRIRSGKDMTEARRRLEELEMKKLIEQRKREKAEEKAARDRVRAQIEADKMARKFKVNESCTPDIGSSKSAPKLATAPSTPSASSNKAYSETRIQIRLQDGSTLVETFNIKEQLSAVRVFIQIKTGIKEPFGMMTSFPRRVFTDDDYEKPLDILGLVPSAVLIITKPTP